MEATDCLPVEERHEALFRTSASHPRGNAPDAHAAVTATRGRRHRAPHSASYRSATSRLCVDWHGQGTRTGAECVGEMGWSGSGIPGRRAEARLRSFHPALRPPECRPIASREMEHRCAFACSLPAKPNSGNLASVPGRLFDLIDNYNFATPLDRHKLQAELLLHCRVQ